MHKNNTIKPNKLYKTIRLKSYNKVEFEFQFSALHEILSKSMIAINNDNAI